ncbi:glycosyltransferase family 2 protein [Thermomonas carbonis]|uniref:Glycosyltransferase family 2 protein n=1 Tax=Thermomonas carbonis TaxID=1463158 RepID=A0A7G9SSM3_9GAMM|nr:glycosyltransferase family 2 protein [Thermomonas carbonis]QNN70848.1 glycosyltransferase family 2 protein [Thermomonas carbonis]GHC02829.1 dolichyl-phosphate mannose synthase [Thermomonas carbonis]
MNDQPQPLTPGRIAVVVPALNEALRIRGVVQGALHHCPNVIVVDDGSDDGTADAIADLPVVLLRHATRMGKGAGLRTGFAEALRRGLDAVVTMDGDGQHSADDIPRLLAAANRRPGWIVIGARLRKRANQPLYRRLANEFGDWGIAWGTGYQVADSQSGQRLYPAEVCRLACTGVPGEDFVFEAQVVMSAAQGLGTRCVSIPIEARYNLVHAAPDFRPSHFRPLRDLWRITSHIVLQCVRRGGLWQVHRRVRAHPPVIDDPAGEFATDAHAAQPR